MKVYTCLKPSLGAWDLGMCVTATISLNRNALAKCNRQGSCLLDMEHRGTSCRYHNAHIPAKMPRIMTTNKICNWALGTHIFTPGENPGPAYRHRPSVRAAGSHRRPSLCRRSGSAASAFGSASAAPPGGPRPTTSGTRHPADRWLSCAWWFERRERSVPVEGSCRVCEHDEKSI